ncbi:Hsp33 family molecular chaperone HslO [Laceyella putida]|uniref:33 kDa chaperonin n=1 Tax=Laceyella putida TaxID=110101 RepID=A0ABW2RRF5_9BACL
MMSDYTIRAISADGQVRGFAAITTQLVQELVRRHHTYPVVSAALGRTATMGALMGLTLKEDHHKVTIQVDGDGPIGRIMVDADGAGHVRGSVDNPMVEHNDDYKLNVGAAVGQGSIYILKDLGLREPYRGASPIISGELAEDFTYYFAVSEQTPSSVGLGVLVKGEEILAAGGYMLQVMPNATDETITCLEKNIAELNQLTSISELFNQGMTPEELLIRLMGEGTEILQKKSVSFQCNCSREKSGGMLKSLGKEELESILAELGQAEVICHYCNEKYVFSSEDLQSMIKEEID